MTENDLLDALPLADRLRVAAVDLGLTGARGRSSWPAGGPPRHLARAAPLESPSLTAHTQDRSLTR